MYSVDVVPIFVGRLYTRLAPSQSLWGGVVLSRCNPNLCGMASYSVGVVPIFVGRCCTRSALSQSLRWRCCTRGVSLVSEKAARALEVMKSLHDFNSVVIAALLGRVRDHYSIPIEYELYTPRSRQRAHDPFLDGFGLTLNALEAGLRFPLHTVIEACLSWWRILPSKMAPNSWRYMVAFFREC